MTADDGNDLIVRLEGLDAALLAELRTKFPQIEDIASPRPIDTPAGDDREASIFELAIPLATASVQLLTAVMVYIASRKKGDSSGPSESTPPKKTKSSQAGHKAAKKKN